MHPTASGPKGYRKTFSRMSEAGTAIRLNPFKGCAGPEGTPVPWSPYGRILAQRPSFTLDPLYHAGCYYVQDSSAMFPCHLLRTHLPRSPFLRVLDLCAAPGGKTTDIAASLRAVLGGNFLLISNEVMKNRAATLCGNVALWGDPAIAVTSADPAAFARLGGFFDVIVADVPCSGEGMFRKDPRALAEWSPETVKLCAARQKRILADVWPSLREGGLLIYSTCTYEEAENDDNLEWAADELGGSIIAPEDEFADSGVRLTRHGSLLEAGVVPGEGQWAGALIKTSSAKPGVSDTAALQLLRPLRHGYGDGEMKGRDFIPDPELPLSLDFDRERWPLVDVDRQTALKFLHRDAITLEGAPAGYVTICFEGHPLGFVKNLGRRCNNLLPKSRRILMDV